MSTRFELRSPNPKTNKYLVLATSYLAMLDGIEACLKHQNTQTSWSALYRKSTARKYFIWKKTGPIAAKRMYIKRILRKNGIAISENRRKRYGKHTNFDNYPEKLSVLREGIFDDMTLESYRSDHCPMGHGTSSPHSSQRNGSGEGVPQMSRGRRLHRFGSAQLGQNTRITHISRAGQDKQKSL